MTSTRTARTAVKSPARRLRTGFGVAALVAAGLLGTGCAQINGSGPESAAADTASAAGRVDDAVIRPTTAIQVHEQPDVASPARTVEATTSFGSPTALLVTGQQEGWVQVLVPGRPTGSKGWVANGDVGSIAPVTTELRIDLAARTLTLTDGDEVVLTTPVAVGAPDSPTPAGTFSVTDKLDTQDPGSDYGRYAIGLSGRSEVLTEFAGGDGQIGIHGTNDPASIGQPVSHGCIRVPEEAMDQLNAVLPLGTPVVVA